MAKALPKVTKLFSKEVTPTVLGFDVDDVVNAESDAMGEICVVDVKQERTMGELAVRGDEFCCGIAHLGEFDRSDDLTTDQRAELLRKAREAAPGLVTASLSAQQKKYYEPSLLKAGFQLAASFHNGNSGNRVYYYVG